MRADGRPISRSQSVLRLVVAGVHGDVQHRGIEAEPAFVGQILPRERDRFAFVVIAEREVAEHLEERAVAARPADVLDVALGAGDAQAALHRDGARRRRAARSPRKTGTNCSIPAIVNSVVDISSGISEADGKCACPFDTKKSTNDARSSWLLIQQPGVSPPPGPTLGTR